MAPVRQPPAPAQWLGVSAEPSELMFVPLDAPRSAVPSASSSAIPKSTPPVMAWLRERLLRRVTLMTPTAERTPA